MTPEQQKRALYEAVTECDSMILTADRDNDQERGQRYSGLYDTARLARYNTRRGALVAHRRGLEALYISLYGEDPWKDVPF